MTIRLQQKAFEHPKWGCRSTGLQLPNKRNLKKNTKFINTIRKFRFSQNQPLRSDEDWHIGILKMVMKTEEYAHFLFSG
jgi:hypothetical protein